MLKNCDKDVPEWSNCIIDCIDRNKMEYPLSEINCKKFDMLALRFPKYSQMKIRKLVFRNFDLTIEQLSDIVHSKIGKDKRHFKRGGRGFKR